MTADQLPQPSFFRFLVCCPFGAHRRMTCDCCGHAECLDCRTELPEPDAGEVEV